MNVRRPTCERTCRPGRYKCKAFHCKNKYRYCQDEYIFIHLPRLFHVRSKLATVTSRLIYLYQIPFGVTSASDMVMVYLDAPMAIFAIAVEATSMKVLTVRKLHIAEIARAPIWLPPRNAQYGSEKQRFAELKHTKKHFFCRG